MPLSTAQQTKQRSETLWVWSVWLEGTDAELNSVDHVTYYLHSTFPDPIVKVDDRESGFRLDGRGWGGFLIRVSVTHRDGTTTELEHQLELEFEESFLGAEQAQPRVIVTYPLSESDLANELSARLMQHGVSPVASEAEVGLAQSASAADGVVAILPNRVPLWLEEDIAEAKGMGVRLVAVARKPVDSERSPGLAGIRTFPIDDSASVDALATDIASTFADETVD